LSLSPDQQTRLDAILAEVRQAFAGLRGQGGDEAGREAPRKRGRTDLPEKGRALLTPEQQKKNEALLAAPEGGGRRPPAPPAPAPGAAADGGGERKAPADRHHDGRLRRHLRRGAERRSPARPGGRDRPGERVDAVGRRRRPPAPPLMVKAAPGPPAGLLPDAL